MVEFTDSQESILQVDIDDVVGVNLESPTLSTDLRTESRIAPLPQIRAEIVQNPQLSFDSSADEEEEDNCSRSSSPHDTDPVLEHRSSISPEDINCELHNQLVEPLNRSSHHS
ncbi:RING-H2 zinc finger domain [Popillia japonica]|uniref:RING-H2 zinc finger domain n=1 Tax=Popillia japonica TaxID=7064 RepID=A0AAW1N3R1_POPJA